MKSFQNNRNKKHKVYSSKETAENTRMKTTNPENCKPAKWKKKKKSKKSEIRQEKEQVHDRSGIDSSKEFSINKKWQKKGKHRKIKFSQSSQDQHSQNGAHKNSLSAKTLTKNVEDDGQEGNGKKILKRGKSQNSPAVPLTKVQTHPALYKKPEEISSNWKKLLKVCKCL